VSRPSLVIVSPAAPAANNGNARTAERWRGFLADDWPVRVVQQWPDAQAAGDGAMIALHARRSAAAIRVWAAAHPGRGLALVLTGTDLYQDLAVDVDAQHSVESAQHLVVLQECGAEALPPAQRGKARTIYQSTPTRPPLAKPPAPFQAVMVGHLRAVKAPQTLWAAARLLRPDEGIRITHIGDASADPRLGDEATACARACPHYEWLGAVPHDETLERMRAAHVLVHASTLEGGAHAVLEAVCCGTPVLASRMPGNVGMLGAGYTGYFPVGDAPALVALLRACQDPASGLLARIGAQCAQRASLFAPAAERSAVLRLAHDLLEVP
jgi:putative glycosyltransferase (TIGR04348 family)